MFSQRKTSRVVHIVRRRRQRSAKMAEMEVEMKIMLSEAGLPSGVIEKLFGKYLIEIRVYSQDGGQCI